MGAVFKMVAPYLADEMNLPVEDLKKLFLFTKQ
jgi:hypothetical protein